MDKNNEKNMEEIDLFDLLKKIGLIIKSFFVYLLRRSIWYTAFIVIGVIFCIYLSSKDRKFYSSMVQFRSKNVNSTLIISRIDALGDILSKRRFDELVVMLHVPKDVIEDVKSIKGLYAIDANRDKYPDYADENERAKKNLGDTTLYKMNDFFYLKLEVYSDKPFISMLQALRDYIGKDDLLRQENEYVILQRKQMLETLKNQVALLDSFQKADYFKRDRVAELRLVDEKGKSLYHQDYISLYKQQQEVEKDLQFYNEVVTPTQNFTPLATPENSLTFYLKKYVGWFLLLGFVCILLWDNRRFLLFNILGKKEKGTTAA